MIMIMKQNPMKILNKKAYLSWQCGQEFSDNFFSSIWLTSSHFFSDLISRSKLNCKSFTKTGEYLSNFRREAALERLFAIFSRNGVIENPQTFKMCEKSSLRLLNDSLHLLQSVDSSFPLFNRMISLWVPRCFLNWISVTKSAK